MPLSVEAFYKSGKKRTGDLKGYIRPIDVNESNEPHVDNTLGQLVSRLEDLQKSMSDMRKEINELKAQQRSQGTDTKTNKNRQQQHNVLYLWTLGSFWQRLLLQKSTQRR